MKSTILFIALLVYVSNTKISPSHDPALLQIAANKKAEGIFAVIAVQLRQDDGFDNIFNVLTELLNDSKKQKVENQLAFTKVKSTSNVTSSDLNERVLYFGNALETTKEQLSELKDGVRDVLNIQNSRNNEQAQITDVKTSRLQLVQDEIDYLLAKLNSIEDVIDLITQTTDDFNSDSSNTEFIQTNLKKIQASMKKASNIDLVIPSEFLQGTTDEETRQRFNEYLADLKVSGEQYQSKVNDQLSSMKNFLNSLTEKFDKCLKDLTGDVENLQTSLDSDNDTINYLVPAIQSLQDILSETQDLAVKNEAYFKSELAAYENIEEELDDSIAMFKDIRDYFKANLAKLKDFIKSKYQ